MDHILFWQTVGAVVIGNTLFALAAFMFWRVGRQEDGRQPGQISLWVYFSGLLAFGVAMFSLYMLP